MYKKITGVPESKDHARQEMIDARAGFNEIRAALKNRKQEFYHMKEENNVEREQIKRERREAEKFKFSKMTKKISFLPALHQQGNFKEDNSVHAIGVPYMDHRDKLKLCIPDKAFKKGIPKWNLQKTCDGDVFSRSVRQEADVYDLDLYKYMTKRERGILRPGQTLQGRTTSAVGGKINAFAEGESTPTD